MIIIPKDLKVGDRVFFWYSQFKKDIKTNGKTKPNEHEYRITYVSNERLGLESVMGGYSIIFSKELIDAMVGECRKTN